MILFDAPVTPDALTAFVREVPLPSNLGLSSLFPVDIVQSNQFDWSEVLQTNRTARFRSFDGRIHVSARDGGSDKRVNLLPLGTSFNMGEYERLQLEFARTGGTRTEALANAIYNDGQAGTRYVQNRMEQAIGDVLVDGKLTINENGLMTEADFSVPANQLPTAATAWTNTAAPALDDLIAWVDLWVAANGDAPGRIMTSQRVKRLMQVNTQLVGAAVGTSSGKTRINDAELADLLASEGLPSVIGTYDTRVDVDGVSTRVVADDRLTFLPADPGEAIRVKYGISATALELVNSNQADLAFEEAAGIVGVVIKEGPPFRQFTFVDAVGMPIVVDGKKLLTAKVL